MDPILFRYRARDLTAGDIAQIQAAIASHYARGRSFVARTLCERWDWRQPNGGYKEFAARDLLLRLEEAGLIELPPRQRVKSSFEANLRPDSTVQASAADALEPRFGERIKQRSLLIDRDVRVLDLQAVAHPLPGEDDPWISLAFGRLLSSCQSIGKTSM